MTSVKGAEDVIDLLRGDDAVLEAAKDGDVEKMRRILMPSTINCRDLRGRYSTPLHLACKLFYRENKEIMTSR